MNGWPKIGMILVLGAVAGFLLGRMTAGEGGQRVRTPEEMSAALRSAFTESDPMLRAREMNRLIDEIDDVNLPGAIEVFHEFSTRAETLGVADFFARWSRIDADGLARAMESWPDERARSQGIGWVAYQYAFEGGTARAVPYFEGLSPRVRLVTGYRLVEGAINKGDDAGLIEWIGSLSDSADRSRLSQSIVFKLLRERGPESVVAFFDSIPVDAPHSYKRQFFLVVLDKLVRNDVDAALAFRDARATEPFAETSSSHLMAAWADVDPVAALAWIEQQPIGEERDKALETLVDRWATRDEAAAIEWTRKQTPSPMIDRLCQQFVALKTIAEPEVAMELAGRIVDPNIRHRSLRGFARYWFVRKPAETRAWLGRGGLSESDAESMIEELTRTREERLGNERPVPAQS